MFIVRYIYLPCQSNMSWCNSFNLYVLGSNSSQNWPVSSILHFCELVREFLSVDHPFACAPHGPFDIGMIC